MIQKNRANREIVTLKKIRALNNPWEYKFFFFSPVEKSKEMKTRSLLFLISSYFDRSPPSLRDALGKNLFVRKGKQRYDTEIRDAIFSSSLIFLSYRFRILCVEGKKKENKKCIFVRDEELNAAFFPRQGEGKMLKKG